MVQSMSLNTLDPRSISGLSMYPIEQVAKQPEEIYRSMQTEIAGIIL
jgi:hypothetical protein